MKRLLMFTSALCLVVTGFCQEDSSKSVTITADTVNIHSADTTAPGRDTLRVGNMIIIKDRKSNKSGDREITIDNKPSTQNVQTTYFQLDLGFSAVNDKTNYPAAIAAGLLPPGANEEWFDQRGFKSRSVGIWIFNQKINMIKHAVNFKYGVGLELNNYRYREPILFQRNNPPLVIMTTNTYKKNKLAADYFTIPIMLNFNLNPYGQHLFDISAGISAGYLFASRQKTKFDGDKQKTRDDFELRKIKLAYVAELGLGPIKIYGSYAFKSMFKNTLDQVPYTFGLRLGNFR